VHLLITVEDAMTALKAMAGPDGADPFRANRPLGGMNAFPRRSGVACRAAGSEFLGDKA